MALKPKAGRILVADPYLQDGYFTRSVVLLTAFNKEDTMGFILNKPSNVLVHEVFEDFPHFESLIYIGGPVDSNLIFFIHRLGDLIPNCTPLGNNWFFGGDFNKLKDLIIAEKIRPRDVRFFLGYSGWGETQLEEEISKKSWIVGDLQPSYIEKVLTRRLWGTCLKKVKPKFGFYGEYAFSPSLN